MLSRIVACGKATTLHCLEEKLAETGDVLVAKSLSVDKERVSLVTLLLALFYDLATEKDFVIPNKPKKRERALRELIRKKKKPVVLFIDEAHDLQSKMLIGLKHLMEMVRDGGGTLSVVLAGHPKLRNELLHPTMEEIGKRATLFSLDNVHALTVNTSTGSSSNAPSRKQSPIPSLAKRRLTFWPSGLLLPCKSGST